MVSVSMYNMSDAGFMYVLSKTHTKYKEIIMRSAAFGECIICISLVFFLQLKPTSNISLISDLNGSSDDGECNLQVGTVEVRHVCSSTAIPFVI